MNKTMFFDEFAVCNFNGKFFFLFKFDWLIVSDCGNTD